MATKSYPTDLTDEQKKLLEPLIPAPKGRGRPRTVDTWAMLNAIFTERLWRTVKYENVYLEGYTSPGEARHGIGTFLAFYNDRRVRQSLGYHTPAEIYYQKGKDSILNMPQ